MHRRCPEQTGLAWPGSTCSGLGEPLRGETIRGDRHEASRSAPIAQSWRYGRVDPRRHLRSSTATKNYLRCLGPEAFLHQLPAFLRALEDEPQFALGVDSPVPPGCTEEIVGIEGFDRVWFVTLDPG
jgi:hypothetical protein